MVSPHLTHLGLPFGTLDLSQRKSWDFRGGKRLLLPTGFPPHHPSPAAFPGGRKNHLGGVWIMTRPGPNPADAAGRVWSWPGLPKFEKPGDQKRRDSPQVRAEGGWPRPPGFLPWVSLAPPGQLSKGHMPSIPACPHQPSVDGAAGSWVPLASASQSEGSHFYSSPYTLPYNRLLQMERLAEKSSSNSKPPEPSPTWSSGRGSIPVEMICGGLGL